MTIDDQSSIYVGGLPYDAPQDSVFDFYGAVVAVKIINDPSTRGKCYGFVTFRNPRSTFDAISDMDGGMEERLKDEGKQKLWVALINAKKNSSHHKMQLTKLHKCCMQVRDYTGRLKSCEHDLQSVFDTTILEDGSDDVGLRRDRMLTIGNALCQVNCQHSVRFNFEKYDL